MAKNRRKTLDARTTDQVMICWIVAIALVAIFGVPWVAGLMCLVAVGGRPAATALARKLRLH